jgi:hypothetical protein
LRVRLIGGERGGIGLLSLCQLLEKGLGRVELERQRRFADSDRGGFLVHLLPLQISFKCVEEQTIMRHAIPIEHLLLFLRSNAVVLVEKVQEGTFWLFQGRVCAGFEVAQVRENAFFKLLRILHWTTESLKAKRQTPHDISSGNVKEIIPARLLECD